MKVGGLVLFEKVTADSGPRLQLLVHVHQGLPMRGDDTVSGKRQQRSALRVTL